MRLDKAFLAIALVFFGQCQASVGDRSWEFVNCKETCIDRDCSGPNPNAGIPWIRRIALWDCSQECDYSCQQALTEQRIKNGEEVLQYHGKWPFPRLGPIQEPAAVLFSLLNFVPNYYGYKLISQDRVFQNDAANQIYLKSYYKLFALAQMNAWIWSSVFHTRDFVLTERLDYFSAMLTILYGLFTVCTRLYRLDRPSMRAYRLALALLCAAFYLGHVGYLSLIRFSYSYNMAAGVVVGLIQNFMWIYYSLSLYKQNGQGWSLWPIYITLSITLGMSLELFDFPPVWGAFDAHSLWHAATVIPCFWWYAWMEKDMHYLKTSTRRLN